MCDKVIRINRLVEIEIKLLGIIGYKIIVLFFKLYIIIKKVIYVGVLIE